MFGFTAQGATGGLEHSRGNKRKMSRETMTSEQQAHSAWVRVAGNFPGVVATQVRGHQQEILPPRARRLGGSPALPLGCTAWRSPCFQRQSAHGDSGFPSSLLSQPARTSVPSSPETPPRGVSPRPPAQSMALPRCAGRVPGSALGSGKAR